MRVGLAPEQEAEAGQLALAFQEAAAEELLQVARLLVSKDDRHLFGQAEFDPRALLLRVAAKAYSAHLRKKKGLPGLQRAPPPLRPGGGVPGPPRPAAAPPVRPGPLHPRLLLLPPLRRGAV